MYADDIRIFNVIRVPSDCMRLQKLLDKLCEWCEPNSLPISVNKCNVISFNRLKTPIQYDYKLLGANLERTFVIRDLGIMLDTKLDFHVHYQTIISKAHKMLGFVNRHCKAIKDIHCFKSLCLSFVQSFVVSVLAFYSVLWCPYSSIWIKKLESVQRIHQVNTPWHDAPYRTRCLILGIQSLKYRRMVA